MRGVRLTTLMQQVIADRTNTGAWADWYEFPGVPESAAACRRFAAQALADCPRADDLILAISELATNAVQWSASGEGGKFIARVRLLPRWARVEVSDSGPALVPPGAGNGLGLLVVREMTDRTGANFSADGHRTAWAEVTWPLDTP